MSLKRFYFSLFALLALSAAAAFAHQNGPGTEPGIITVAKAASDIGDYSYQYTTIQAAVNAAKEGTIIEILDEAEYAEQVTIEGREDRRWPSAGAGQPAPVGGKNWITIRYRPPSANAATRPSIKWQDTQNRSPKNLTEGRRQGDSTSATVGQGTSGNFETNGALRIIRAQGIKIEGITVDGGGAAPFYNADVWPGDDKNYGLLHGNAAIAVAVAGDVQIRDCELRNAYFGIAVKDRNTGGVFGSPNPGDNDATIPLSGFGTTGYHLFEYNKIHNNSVGIFFESSWDRGSTVRYNLIYSNYHQTAATATMSAGKDDTKAAGALSFKDNYLSPVAIYNNTFHDNAGLLVGAWQVGYQHLIFNNIFGGNHDDKTLGTPVDNQFNIVGKFPNRMKHNAVGGASTVQIANISDLCPEYRDSIYIEHIQYDAMGQIPESNKRTRSFETCRTQNGTVVRQRESRAFFGVGIVLSGPATAPFAADANNRWLEMSGWPTTGTARLPMLFRSVNATSPDFLVPNWDRPEVAAYIRNGGWPAGGILNEDGTVADLGAIPFSGKRPGDGAAQKLRARVSPFSVVTVTGTTATASIAVNQEVGATGALTIKYIRWVVPIPNNKDSWGGDGAVVPSASIRTVTGADGRAVADGNSKITFTVPQLGANDSTGFFEVVLSGPNGTTDVGFLPYRRLDYKLDIKVSGAATCVTPGTATVAPVIQAGCPVTMTVTAMKRGSGGAADTPYNTGAPNTPLQVDYNLALPAARMWRDADRTPPALTYDANLATGAQYSKTYTVYFTKAGDEIIAAAGLWCEGGRCESQSALRIAFLGDLQVTVKPGAPAKIVFKNPVPSSQTTKAVPPITPPTIVGTYPVEVEVQDRYENPVDTRLQVGMTSLHPIIGDVESPTAFTDPATGRASFTATIKSGGPGEVFDLEASSGALARDTGSLRVGRAADALRVFYYNSGKNGKDWEDDYDEVEEIDTLVNTATKPAWVQVWVKVVNLTQTGDTVVTSKSGPVCVTASDANIRFSATGSGAGAAGPYLTTLTGGVGTFWITSDEEVLGGSLTAGVKTTPDCGGVKDASVSDGSRGGITFRKPKGNAGSAFVTGDGYGRPEAVEISFVGTGGFAGAGGTWRDPDSVKLSWPGVCAGAVSYTSKSIQYLPDGVIRVAFPPAAFPEGHTNVTAAAAVTIYGADDNDCHECSPTQLIDSIGPIIGREAVPALCGTGPFTNPWYEEVTSPATPYKLRLMLTEPLAAWELLAGNSILIASDSTGANPRPLTVESVDFAGGVYTLTLSTTSVLVEGAWIRLNPAHIGVSDAGGHLVSADNRWVQIFQQEAPAELTEAWYTTADNTGRIDFVYIKFNKALTDAGAWFNGGSFSFKRDGIGVFSISADNIGSVTLDPADTENKTIRINMAAMLPGEFNKITDGKIWTGGGIEVSVTFNSAKGWAPIADKPVGDKARPVLISAVLQVGSVNEKDEAEPDMLILTFSESSLWENYASTLSPVSIWGGGGWSPVVVRTDIAPVPGADGSYYVLTYTVDRFGGGDPASRDSVKINELAGVADRATPPNVQNQADNHRVLLEIRPGKPNWMTRVKNNPFRDSVVVLTTPNAKGDVLSVTGFITLYDNMGKLVVDTVAYNNPATGNAVEWVWKGRNRQGRTVGTGTYLFKARYTAVDKSGNKVDPQQVTRSIGFVRGRQQ